MVRRIPFVSLAIVQFISLIVLPCLTVPFCLKMQFPMLALPVATIAVVWAVDVVIFILSFTNWWNKPLQISKDGMAKGKGPIFRYEDAVVFSFKKRIPTQYGRTSGILTIRYKNGVSISFEYNEVILRTINDQCPDKTFMVKLKESSK